MTRSFFIRAGITGLVVIGLALLMLKVQHMTIDLIFALVLIGGAVLAVVIAKFILSRLGDTVGASIYLPAGNAPEAAPVIQNLAATRIEHGDYEGAIQEYEATLREKPDDTQTVFEITQIYAEHLKDTGRAIAFLDAQLASSHWNNEGVAFLMFRKADLLSLCAEQIHAARETLEAIIQRFPDTPFSAHAHHQLNHLNEAATASRLA